MLNDISATQSEYLSAIEDKLAGLLSGGGGTDYAVLCEAMAYSAVGGGKRLRATLALEFCRAFCGDYNRALPFAAAVEMVHAYSLIHDDLPCMDNDTMRRGKPCCHIKYGEANALLAGDALLAKAFFAASDEGGKTVGADIALRCTALLSAAAGESGMVGGQVIDLKYEGKSGITVDDLVSLHRLKTGALIMAACAMGAVAGGAGEENIERAKSFGESLGLAFQIVDDVLDVSSTEAELGKNIGSDLASGKTTFVTLYGENGAMELAESYIKAAENELEEMGIEADFLKQVCHKVLDRRN